MERNKTMKKTYMKPEIEMVLVAAEEAFLLTASVSDEEQSNVDALFKDDFDLWN